MSSVHHAALRARTDIARGILALTFETSPDEPPLQFRTGQFISLRVGFDASGDPILRSYSLASRPGPRTFLIVIKNIPGGVASEYLTALPVGETVRFTGPMGFFVLDLQHAGDVVFGATGTGIAPIVPMIEETLERAETGRVELFWGSRFEDELFWQTELAHLVERHPRFSVHTYVSQPTGATSLANATHGRITEPLLATAKTADRPVYYLCGNGAMIREVKAGLVAAGVDRRKQIRNEAFFG